MELTQKDVDRLVESCTNKKAGLENVKPYEDVQPTTDLLSVAASMIDKETFIGGKDEW